MPGAQTALLSISHFDYLSSVQILGEVWVLPESPRFLVRSGKMEKARQSIRRLKIYKDPSDIDALVRQLQTEMEQTRFVESQRSVERGDAVAIPSSSRGFFETAFRVCLPFLPARLSRWRDLGVDKRERRALMRSALRLLVFAEAASLSKAASPAPTPGSHRRGLCSRAEYDGRKLSSIFCT